MIANIEEATRTKTVLCTNSDQVGQVTLLVNSSILSLMYNLRLSIIYFKRFRKFFFAGKTGLEPAANGFGDRHSTN